MQLSIVKKIRLSNHIKKEYVMSLMVKHGYQETNNNNLTYRFIDEDNMTEFYGNDFIHPSCFKKGRYIGIYAGGAPAGFLAVALQGEQGDFYHVRHSDICLRNVFLFPKFRGRGIMQDAISHCIYQYFPGNKDTMKISLFVRKDNAKAIRFYTKMGFLQNGEITVLRLIKDYYMPPKRTI